MAIQATSEEQLRLKKRARQRLLGAATLLIGAAIVLPMVLDQAPRSLNSDIVINMPGAADSASPAAVPAPAVPAVEAAAPAPAVAAATDKPEAASKAQTDAAAAESHSADAAQQKKTDEAKRAQQQEAELKAAAANAAAEKARQAHDKEIARQAALAEEKARQTAKVKQAAATPPAVQPVPAKTNLHADATGHFVVQLGAFSSADNVRQLRERLNAVGVTTYTENLPSGATRVRAGPFGERGQADKVLAKINAAGVQAQIVPLTHK